MDKRPDILIFNPDQWRGDVMGHLGNAAAVTPNLDQLVAEDAVSFRNAFVQATVCTPSRCSFMTGWYPHVFGHRTMYHMLHGAQADANLLRVLRDSGYFVWWGGKNDLIPGQDGYQADCDISFRAGRADYERWGYAPQPDAHIGDQAWRGEQDSDSFYSFFKGRLETGDQDLYFDPDWSMIFGALDFIKAYDGDKPLCIFLPIGFPHPPYCVEDPWFSIIDRDKLPPRINIELADKPALVRGIQAGQNLTDWDEQRWVELRATYYGMCARVDHQFGLIKKALKESGRYDNTGIFVLSDHGDFTGDYGLVEKSQNTLEDCLARVPFIIKPPKTLGAVAGIRDQLVELVDFPATVYALADIEPDYWHFGKSLVEQLTATDAIHRDAVFCEGGRLRNEVQASEAESFKLAGDRGLYSPRIKMQIAEGTSFAHSKATMCRTQRYKYIRRLYEQDELYDLQQDPGETKNLITSAAHSNIRADLVERMLLWYQETCDIVPFQTDQRFFQRSKT
ncbi:MAG: sulfatase-like hydrolase/transferase [bacterium]|nr:DUF4976 domain-containing protein [Gammaproteobacteria bacterium]